MGAPRLASAVGRRRRSAVLVALPTAGANGHCAHDSFDSSNGGSGGAGARRQRSWPVRGMRRRSSYRTHHFLLPSLSNGYMHSLAGHRGGGRPTGARHPLRLQRVVSCCEKLLLLLSVLGTPAEPLLLVVLVLMVALFSRPPILPPLDTISFTREDAEAAAAEEAVEACV